MPAKIRVHELAKELGLTNKEALDLAIALGIGVKSHSSSIEDAQADRVRRRAERDGLIRDQQPEEPAPEKKSAKKAAKAGAKAEPVGEPAPETPAPAPAAAAAPPAPPTDEPPVVVDLSEPEPEKRREPAVARAPQSRPGGAARAIPPPPGRMPVAPVRGVVSSGRTPPPRRPTPPGAPMPAGIQPEPEAPTLAPAARADVPAQAPPTVAPTPPTVVPTAPVTTSAPIAESPNAPAPSAESPNAPAPSAESPSAESPNAPAPSAEAPTARAVPPAPGAGPRSNTGKPIPPPPGPPRSNTGKPIPPPPGLGGRRAAPTGGAPTRPGARPGGPGGGTGGPSGPRGPRPGGFTGAPSGPGAGRGPGGGGPGMMPPGGGGRPGPGGRPGGPGGGAGRRPPRRKGRRRRSLDELVPMNLPSYTPREAPVPPGMVVIERGSTAQDVGPKLNRTAADVVRFLLQQGEMVTATQTLSDDMIELFSAEIGAEIRLVDPGEEQEVELQKLLDYGEDDDEYDTLPLRAPVITVMGHVDHGKTKLLDQIRNTNVVAGEAGGITQHIGAYQVVRDGHALTFIDTPGHAAFTAMRARGAQVTDIVVLVVAADDGVMPQTIEALNHAKAADVPIVVAINKIDREQADPQRVMSQLSEHGLVPESWGGDTIMVELSALQNLGVDDLLENLVAVAELEDLRARPDGRARGSVLEAHLDIGRGPVATVLVESGTLRVGEPLVAGAAWGRVRALIDDKGRQVKSAGPSTPVQVLGLSDVADAGDPFIVAPSEKVASRVASTREHWHRMANLARDAHAMSGGAKLEDIFKQIQAGESATLNLILKADVTGSLEAVTESLRKLERDEVKLAFIHRAVGGITQYDIQLAAASNATILGFNVRPDRKARELADREHVEIRSYEIIYKLLEDIEAAMVGMLAPEFEEIITGDAEVRAVFRVPRVGAVAGCYVTNGVITRGSKVRFLRDGTIIWKGEVSSLKRFKEDTREVATGYECGIGLSDFQDLKEGDIIETFEEREIPRS